MEVPCCVVYATRSKVHWKFYTDNMAFASTLIRHHTHRHIHHRDRHTDTHKQRYISIYKYVAAAICIALLNEQITDIKKLTYAAGLQ